MTSDRRQPTPPVEVAAYLEGIALEARAKAYALLDVDGIVVDLIGDLEHFGLGDHVVGAAAVGIMPFLHGVLPYAPPPVCFRSVDLDVGRFADVHVFGTSTETWVVLIDATELASSQARVQQPMNESALARARAEVDGVFAASIFATIDALALLGKDDGSYVVLGSVPKWFSDLGGNVVDGFARPQDLSPFLENFLIDAEEFWTANAEGTLRSGAWAESGPDGDFFLEATAANVAGRRFLMVGEPRLAFAEKQRVVQMARELALEHEKLVRELQKKEILLHCIVHDLRQPLASISAAADMIAMGSLDEKQKRYVDICARQSSRLDLLIGSILHAFASEVDDFDPASVTADNAPDALECARETAASLSPSFARSNISLVVEPGAEGADWHVIAEKRRLERVLWNLCGNALRHSQTGGAVTIRLETEGEQVTVSVEDRGSGVPADTVPDLFRRFAQGKGKSGSVGLGLYFCRITVERWGGEIGYAPREGGGSRFWFRLPRFVDE